MRERLLASPEVREMFLKILNPNTAYGLCSFVSTLRYYL